MATRTPRRATTPAKAARKTQGTASPSNPSAGISRIDQPARRTHGFFVRVGYKRTSDGYRPQLSAFFGDVSHGGKRGAWEAAERWLNKARRDVSNGAGRGGRAKTRSR